MSWVVIWGERKNEVVSFDNLPSMYKFQAKIKQDICIFGGSMNMIVAKMVVCFGRFRVVSSNVNWCKMFSRRVLCCVNWSKTTTIFVRTT